MKSLIPPLVLVALLFLLRSRFQADLEGEAKDSEALLRLADYLKVDTNKIAIAGAKSYLVQNFPLIVALVLVVYVAFGFAFHKTY